MPIWPELVFQSFDRFWPNHIWPELVFFVFWPCVCVFQDFGCVQNCVCLLCVWCMLLGVFEIFHGPSAGPPKISLFGLHPRTPNVHISGSGASNTTKINSTKGPPREGRKNENCDGRGKKTRNLGPPTRGPAGRRPFWAPPFGDTSGHPHFPSFGHPSR